MPEERPRPKYGEYATPQDQAKSIANSLPPVSPLLAPHDRPAAQKVVSAGDQPITTAPAPTPTAPAPAPRVTGEMAQSPKKVRRRRRWDVILTVALLTYGFVVAVSGLVQPIDVAKALGDVYRMQGIGDFTSVELAQSIGLGITFSNVVIFALTLVVTVRSLLAKRISFYWPLVGGAVAAIIGGVLLFVVIINDPAFSAYVGSAG